jgi:hypothetical protein
VAVFPYLVTALLLLAIGIQLFQRVRRIKSGLPPVPPRSRAFRLFRIVWLLIVLAVAIWFVVGTLRRPG